MVTDSTIILRWWRDLGKEKRKEIMNEKGIKAITYSEIKTIYNESIH